MDMEKQKVFSGLRLDQELTNGLEKARKGFGGRAGDMPIRRIIRMYIREGLVKDGFIPKDKKERK